MHRLIYVLCIALTLPVIACGKKAPQLVGQAGNVVADSVYSLNQAGEKLEKAGLLPTAVALGFQERLLQVNNKLKELPPILRALDVAQQAGESTTGLVNQAIAILKVLSSEVSIVIAGVPVSEVTKPILALVQAVQDTVISVLLEIAKLRGDDAPPDAALNALLAAHAH